MKVAIQGIVGSFHEQAAQKLLGETIEIVPCPTFPQVFEAVKNGKADYGVAAVENSLHGSINDVYRLLAKQHAWVAGEVFLQIEQYLIARPGATLTATTRVLSQDPALAQCEQWLADNLPHATLEVTHDTAESVRAVLARADEPLAAIASKKAAHTYGGEILAGPINDDLHNYTRFFLLTPKEVANLKANRTSIIMRTNHQPGALWRALGVFEEHKVNLSKLDSHPISGDRRHYRFYIDFDLGLHTESAQQIISELRNQGCTVQILGSYQAASY